MKVKDLVNVIKDDSCVYLSVPELKRYVNINSSDCVDYLEREVTSIYLDEHNNIILGLYAKQMMTVAQYIDLMKDCKVKIYINNKQAVVLYDPNIHEFVINNFGSKVIIHCDTKWLENQIIRIDLYVN